MVDVVLLHHTVPESWKHFPEYLRRVRAFCAEFDSDMNVQMLEDYLRASFIAPKPPALMIVGVDDDGIVFGHTLAIAETWFGHPTVTVVQLQSDMRIPKDIWDRCRTSVELFAQAHHAKFIQLAARSKALVRLYRKHGFTEERTIMRMPFDGRAGQPDQGVV